MIRLYVLIGCVLLAGCVQTPYSKVDGAINFAYAVCRSAGVQDCERLHDRYLPDDVLSPAAFQERGPGSQKCTITGDSVKDCCHFRMVAEDLGDGRMRIKESGVECDKSCKAEVRCPTVLDEIIGLQLTER